MKKKFKECTLRATGMAQLNLINDIVEEYQSEGYRLTLRQLYYQLVSRDVIPNKPAEYAKLSKLLTQGRMAGIVDWSAIEDRVRVPSKPSAWNSPKDILEGAADQYRRNRMDGQNIYIEVWVEKDALSGVLKRVTRQYGINILVNRGYSSCSAMFDAWERFQEALEDHDEVVILYLGDFDPSGQDMIRDINERITEFAEGEEGDYMEGDFENYFSIIPIALTWEQIKAYTPPPNPAKIDDPRAKEYIAKHGEYSWEVDALRPEVLNRILTDEIESRLDMELYEEVCEREGKEKKKLLSFVDEFDEK